MGINSPAAFQDVESDDLVDAGFTAEEAQGIIARVIQE
jgi:N utilization substance protein A